MAFDADYWHALDKQAAQNLDMSAKDIGISYGAGDVLDSFQTGIRIGAGTVELGFTGRGKGNLGGGATTPEMFGKDKREAIRQFAKINDVTPKVHATVAVQGLAGFDPQRGFSDAAASETMQEIRRAVDFAADVTQGGPVTVHTSEFPREIREIPGFEPYPLEEYKTPEGEIKKKVPKEEMVVLVDKETGKIMPFQKGQIIWEPEWKKNTKGEFIGYDGQPLKGEDKWDVAKRAPIMDEKTDEVKFQKKDWWDIERETNAYNEEHPEHKLTPGQLFLTRMRQSELNRQKPYAMMWYERYKDYEKMEKAFGDSYESYTDLERSADTPEKMARIRRKALEEFGGRVEVPEDKLPSEVFKEKLGFYKRAKEAERQGWIGIQEQMKEIERQNKDVVPMKNIGVERSAQNVARAAMYAYEKEKQMNLKNPLFIAPENVFPEGGYGSHPDELRELILESRKAMAKQLEQRGYGKDEARQVAGDHIKATFDIGHAYTWKKFFKAEPGESFEQTEKRFNTWLMKEVDKLNKAGIIGHVHLSDNFGYYDEHLIPGTGSVPMKEFVEKMRKSGHMEPMIVEPGAQRTEEFYQAMTGGWSHLAGSPMYRTAKWTDIEDSYFGQVKSPTYIVGKYAPSQEYLGTEKGAPFWSGLGLE